MQPFAPSALRRALAGAAAALCVAPVFAQQPAAPAAPAATSAPVNTLAKVAASGDKAAVQKAFGETGATCKACHDKYRAD